VGNKSTLVVYTNDNRMKVRDGRKTETRRVMSPAPSNEWSPYGGITEIHGRNQRGEFDHRIVKGYGFCNEEGDEGYVSPYGRPGDTLLLAEPVKFSSYNLDTRVATGIYLDDEEPFRVESAYIVKKLCMRKRPFAVTSARFMYKALARTRFVITDVRAERLQEITEEDALAEGVDPLFSYDEIHSPRYHAELDLRPMPYQNYLWHGRRGITGKQVDAWDYQFSSYKTAVGSFSSLWESIYGTLGYGWKADPFVWVYSFERLQGVEG